MTPKTAKKKEEKGEGCPDFTFSYTTKAFEFISSQCSEQKGKLTPNPDFRCSRCQGRARPIDGRPQEKWTLAEGEELEVVDTFCYLGDTINGGGGCSPSVVKRVRAAWGKFRELLPLVTSRAVSPSSRGYIYSTYIRKVLTYASESWAPTVADIQKLQRNDRAMIRWICGVRLEDKISSESLLLKLEIVDLQTLIRYNRLQWFGHVQRSEGPIKDITELEVAGQRRRGRPNKTWSDTIRDDRKRWNASRVDPMDRVEWRKKLRTNVCNMQPTLSGK